MPPRTTTVAVALLAFVAGVTAGGGAAVAALEDPFAGQPDASLQRFDTVAVGCVDPTERGAVDRSVSAPNGSGSDLTLRENVTVPSPDADLDARFDRIAPGTYLLDVRTVPAERERTCEAGRPEARFVANVTLPDEYALVLLRDGEYVGVNYASSGPMSGSAGAGRSASGGGGGSDASGGGGGSTGGASGGAAGDSATSSES